MHLHRLFIPAALLIGTLFQCGFAEGVHLAQQNGFYYFYDRIDSVPNLRRGDPISSYALAQYAARAYRQMISTPGYQPGQYPGAMTALWLVISIEPPVRGTTCLFPGFKLTGVTLGSLMIVRSS